uniref:E-selectin n=1 Tax=Myripristis murdjan TaxID=586833 RepID=A0A667YCK1_9TELE
MGSLICQIYFGQNNQVAGEISCLSVVISPGRNWNSARQWCQQHFTDMVAIQNQQEISFLNQLLPYNPSYYWIGIRKVAGVWTWVGTNKSLTTEAENWATGEPNNELEDCVEIYIKRGNDMAKWNDERCNKRKGTLCYTASCSQDSCSVHADCVETIGNYTCQCHPGFQEPHCEQAIVCQTILDPEQGSHHCFDSYGPYSFNSSCRFHCNLGFRLVGAPRLVCQANGHWDHPAPLCQALNYAPTGGSMDCSHPIAPYSYNSTCEINCDEGYEFVGQNQIRCDHTGQWTGNWSHALPVCQARRCNLITAPPHGSLSCLDPNGPFRFGSKCVSVCEEGFLLNGTDTECTFQGTWSAEDLPTCQLVQCEAIPALSSPLSMNCSHTLRNFSFGSRCLFTCEEGYSLNGTKELFCSSSGLWSDNLPTCTGKAGAASGVAVLILIGLGLLIAKQFKRKKGKTK